MQGNASLTHRVLLHVQICINSSSKYDHSADDCTQSLFVINHKKSVYFNQSNIVLFMKMIALGTGNSHDCGPLPVHTITPPRNEH